MSEKNHIEVNTISRSSLTIWLNPFATNAPFCYLLKEGRNVQLTSDESCNGPNVAVIFKSIHEFDNDSLSMNIYYIKSTGKILTSTNLPYLILKIS